MSAFLLFAAALGSMPYRLSRLVIFNLSHQGRDGTDGDTSFMGNTASGTKNIKKAGGRYIRGRFVMPPCMSINMSTAL